MMAPVHTDSLVSAPASPSAGRPVSAPESAGLAPILAPIAPGMAQLDDVIRARLSSDVALIGTIAEYIISAGGKRLRPALLLMTAGALGGIEHAAVTLAAVIEFIHTATLLHDDVVDESELRRGRPTSNAAFGNAASVLVGDFLYSRAFQMMVDVGIDRVMKVLSDATNRIAEGEVLQLMNAHDPDVDEARYMGVIERKTATLFEAATRLGAIVSGAPPALEAACARYGASIGTAFQIIDDVLDYEGSVDVIGKRLGDDLREGKPTLPIIQALRLAKDSERAVIEHAIRHGDGDFAEIARIVRSSGSIDYARAQAVQQCHEAAQSAQELPPSVFRDRLLELSSFAMRRDR
jgi:octaprenyl-diphosphate synthase